MHKKEEIIDIANKISDEVILISQMNIRSKKYYISKFISNLIGIELEDCVIYMNRYGKILIKIKINNILLPTLCLTYNIDTENYIPDIEQESEFRKAWVDVVEISFILQEVS